MIEKIDNCPNCGAVLDDTGRCKYCGSKVYDLFDIDVSDNHSMKYLRIKTNKGLVLAPIVCNTIKMDIQDRYCSTYDMLATFAEGRRFVKTIPDITIGVEFNVVGDMTFIEEVNNG